MKAFLVCSFSVFRCPLPNKTWTTAHCPPQRYGAFATSCFSFSSSASPIDRLSDITKELGTPQIHIAIYSICVIWVCSKESCAYSLATSAWRVSIGRKTSDSRWCLRCVPQLDERPSQLGDTQLVCWGHDTGTLLPTDSVSQHLDCGDVPQQAVL